MSDSYISLFNTSEIQSLTSMNVDDLTINSSLNISGVVIDSLPVDNYTILYTSNQLKVNPGSITDTYINSNLLNGAVSNIANINSNLISISSNVQILQGNVLDINSNIVLINSNIITLTSQLDGKVDKPTSTANAIVRFVGTSGNIQNSNVVIDEGGNITGLTSINDTVNIGNYKFDGLKLAFQQQYGTSGQCYIQMVGGGSITHVSNTWVEFVAPLYGACCNKFSSLGSDITITPGIADSVPRQTYINSNVLIRSGNVLFVDNINSITANANILLLANGTGVIQCNSNIVVDKITSRTANVNLQLGANGTGLVQCNSNVIVDKITSRTTNGDMTIEANGTGKIILGTTSNAVRSSANFTVMNGAGIFADALSSNSTNADLNLTTTTTTCKVNVQRDLAVAGNIAGGSANQIQFRTISTDTASVDLTLTTQTTGQKIIIPDGRKLEIRSQGKSGSGGSTPGMMKIWIDTTTSYAINAQDTGSESGSWGSATWVRGGGTAIGSITHSYGTLTTTYATSSDHRLKINIAPMSGALDRLMTLNPITHNWISENDPLAQTLEKRKTAKIKLNGIGKKSDGFLAHEVMDIVPYAVIGDKDEIDSDGNPVYQQLDYSKIVPLLCGAIQELKMQVDDMKKKSKAPV